MLLRNIFHKIYEMRVSAAEKNLLNDYPSQCHSCGNCRQLNELLSVEVVENVPFKIQIEIWDFGHFRRERRLLRHVYVKEVCRRD